LNGRRVLAVVPARGGSKGVPLKNIHPLAGQPLIAHTGRLLQQLPWIDQRVVSTDSDAIAGAAEVSGLAAPFRRPERLSGDRIGDFDVLEHALLECERLDGCSYDVVLMLQPTSPLRRAEHVQRTAEAVASGNWDAAWTVSPTDLKYHPLKALTVDEGGGLGFQHENGRAIVARQELQPVYHRNGAAYAFSRECLLTQRTIMGSRTRAVVVKEYMVSIDTLEDFERVEQIMSAVL